MRGSVALGRNSSLYMRRINMYFQLCDITKEKINYIENKTKMNLSKFKMMIEGKPNIENHRFSQ